MIKHAHIRAHSKNKDIQMWLNEKQGRYIELCKALSIYPYKLIRLLEKPLSTEHISEIYEAMNKVQSTEHGIVDPYNYIKAWTKAKRGRVSALCAYMALNTSNLFSLKNSYITNSMVKRFLEAMNHIENSEVSRYTNELVIDWVNSRHGRISALARVMGTTRANEQHLLSKVRYISKDMYEIYMAGIDEVEANEDPFVYETPELDIFLAESNVSKTQLSIELGKSNNYIYYILTKRIKLTKSVYKHILETINRLSSKSD